MSPDAKPPRRDRWTIRVAVPESERDAPTPRREKIALALLVATILGLFIIWNIAKWLLLNG